jgi:hypothetical protein
MKVLIIFHRGKNASLLIFQKKALKVKKKLRK